jgi:hypothetical protein
MASKPSTCAGAAADRESTAEIVSDARHTHASNAIFESVLV